MVASMEAVALVLEEEERVFVIRYGSSQGFYVKWGEERYKW